MKGSVNHDMIDAVVIQHMRKVHIQEKTIFSTFIQNDGNTLYLRIHEMGNGNTGIRFLSLKNGYKQKGA